MIDEGMNAQNLPVEELQKIKGEHINRIGEITRKHKPSDKNAPQYALEMLQHLMQAASYMDVLVKKLPDDPSVYEEAVNHLFLLGQFEEALQGFRTVIGLTPRSSTATLCALGSKSLKSVQLFASPAIAAR